MGNGPFENKAMYKSYNNFYDFAVALFNKAIKGNFRVKPGLDIVRDYVIKFEGPDNRNRNVDIDNADFYMEEYAGKHFWIGVTSISNEALIYSYKHMMDPGDSLIFIEDCGVETAERTIHTVKVMKQFLIAILNEWFTDSSSYTIDRVNSFIITHLIANYMYREFGINLSIKENFYATIVSDENSDVVNKLLYDFFIKDFKYVGTIENSDIDVIKLRGTPYRFTYENEDFVRKSHLNNDDWVEDNNEGESETSDSET